MESKAAIQEAREAIIEAARNLGKEYLKLNLQLDVKVWQGLEDSALAAIFREVRACTQECFRPKAVQVEMNMAGSVLLMISMSPRGGTPFHLDRADAYNIAIPVEPQISGTQVVSMHSV